MAAISQEKLIQIKNRIHKKVKFYSQLWAYLIICCFLTFIDYFDGGKYGYARLNWVYWVWLGWGIAITFSFVNAFVYPDYEDKMMQKEIEKENKI